MTLKTRKRAKKIGEHLFVPSKDFAGRESEFISVCKKCGYSIMNNKGARIKKCPAWKQPEWNKGGD